MFRSVRRQFRCLTVSDVLASSSTAHCRSTITSMMLAKHHTSTFGRFFMSQSSYQTITRKVSPCRSHPAELTTTIQFSTERRSPTSLNSSAFTTLSHLKASSHSITPTLASLRWLPVTARIDHKAALFTFNTLTIGHPRYLHELLQVHRLARLLRSNEQINRLHDHVARTSFASRAFCQAAPTVWNDIPRELTNGLSSWTTLKRQ